MPYVILLVVVVVAYLAVETYLRKRKADRRKQQKETVAENSRTPFDPGQYFLRGSVVTENELGFYKQLVEIVPDSYIIAPKVGLKDFVGVKSGGEYMRYFGIISQKHIDFMICRRDNLSPWLGIEIDDLSHRQKNRMQRDRTVDQIYNQIGLRVLHIPTNTTKAALETAVKNALEPKAPEQIES